MASTWARFDYRPLDVGRHLQARVTAEAMNRAQALDRLLYRERVKLFGQGEFQGWDVSVSRLFFVRALMARELGVICDRSFSESSIGVFRPTRPQQFYFDSFVTTDLFTAGSPRWKVVDHYDTTLNWVDDSNASCFDFDQIKRRGGRWCRPGRHAHPDGLRPVAALRPRDGADLLLEHRSPQPVLGHSVRATAHRWFASTRWPRGSSVTSAAPTASARGR